MQSRSVQKPLQKVKLVISDFHLSAGKWLKNGKLNPLEDFHQDEKFAEFLDFYSSGEYATASIELIINGDFFDPLAVTSLHDNSLPQTGLDYPLEVSEPYAIDKFNIIISGHPIVFSALKLFMERGKRILFRWGNHDVGILWPSVQKHLTEVLNPADPRLLEFQVYPYIFDGICVDHGNQYEIINHFDPDNVFIERKGEKILNLPFGSFFVQGFLNELKMKRSYINQVTPFRTYLAMSFYMDPVFFIVNGIRVSWFFIKMRFVTHPMRFSRLKKTFFILLEIFNRPSLEQAAEHVLGMASSDILILGHDHQAMIRTFSNGKQYVNTGTWTPITSLSMETLGRRIIRSYALIEYVDGKPRVSLKVWNGHQEITEDFP